MGTLAARFVSRRSEEILGTSPEEYLHNPRLWLDQVHPSDRPHVFATIERAVASGEDQPTEVRMLASNGLWVWLSGWVTPVKDRAGRVRRLRGIVMDVTERKRVESRLAVVEAAVQAADTAVVITDAKGDVTWVNPAFSRITGYAEAECLGRNLRFLKSGLHPASLYETLWKTILAGQVWKGELVNRKKDGTLLTVEQTIVPVRDAEGRIAHFVAVTRDVTEARALEERLRRSQKMEALGRLAGAISHDFNNLLAVVAGYAELVARRLPEGEDVRRDLDELRSAVHRGRALTRQLLSLGQRPTVHIIDVDLNALVRGREPVLRKVLGDVHGLDLRLADGLPRAVADPIQMEQVLVNLVSNARDAMVAGGSVTVETSEVTVDPVTLRPAQKGEPGRFVKLAVTDLGSGIDPAVLPRLFEPFVTTKEPGVGSGLGLAAVWDIVTACGGHVDVETSPGLGTTIAILLQVA